MEEETSFWDGAFDAFSSVGEDITKSVAQDAGSWLKGTVGGFLKVGEAPKGNLSQAEIASGARGQAPGQFLSGGLVAQALSPQNNTQKILLGVAIALGAFLILKRR